MLLITNIYNYTNNIYTHIKIKFKIKIHFDICKYIKIRIIIIVTNIVCKKAHS